MSAWFICPECGAVKKDTLPDTFLWCVMHEPAFAMLAVYDAEPDLQQKRNTK